MAKKIAFFGLGNMGGPMAANLVKAGFEVCAFDLQPASVTKAVEDGCSAASSEKEAVAGADFVISMLPNGAIAESLYIDGAGLLDLVEPSALLIDCSTVAASSSRRIGEEAKKRNIRAIDAPVSGGVGGAQAGTLAFMWMPPVKCWCISAPIFSMQVPTVPGKSPKSVTTCYSPCI